MTASEGQKTLAIFITVCLSLILLPAIVPSIRNSYTFLSSLSGLNLFFAIFGTLSLTGFIIFTIYAEHEESISYFILMQCVCAFVVFLFELYFNGFQFSLQSLYVGIISSTVPLIIDGFGKKILKDIVGQTEL